MPKLGSNALSTGEGAVAGSCIVPGCGAACLVELTGLWYAAGQQLLPRSQF